MAIYCRCCGVSNFRPSRFRLEALDLSRLLVLHLPVRCLTCDERSYVFLPQFLKLRSAGKPLHPEHRNVA